MERDLMIYVKIYNEMNFMCKQHIRFKKYRNYVYKAFKKNNPPQPSPSNTINTRKHTNNNSMENAFDTK